MYILSLMMKYIMNNICFKQNSMRVGSLHLSLGQVSNLFLVLFKSDTLQKYKKYAFP